MRIIEMRRVIRCNLGWVAILLTGCQEGIPPHEEGESHRYSVLKAFNDVVTESDSPQPEFPMIKKIITRQPFGGSNTSRPMEPEFRHHGISLQKISYLGQFCDRHGCFALIQEVSGEVVRISVGDRIGQEEIEVIGFDIETLTLKSKTRGQQESLHIVRGKSTGVLP